MRLRLHHRSTVTARAAPEPPDILGVASRSSDPLKAVQFLGSRGAQAAREASCSGSSASLFTLLLPPGQISGGFTWG